MFKKGDYIVCLKLKNSQHYRTTKVNFITKQSKDSKGLYVESDTNNKPNGSDDLSFDKSKDLVDWRYATKEEKAEYDRLGHGFYICDLKDNKSLKVEDLENDKCYVGYDNTRSNYLFKPNKCEILLNNNSFYKGNSPNFAGPFYREATEEEKTWLEACILADKFIPKEEALKSKSSKVKKDYIGLLNKWCTNDDWIGKSICKVSNLDLDNSWVYFSEAYTNLYKISESGKWWLSTRVKLATEEEILDYLPKDHPDRLAILNKNKVEKESDNFPDKWCIKPKDKEEALVISKWFDENHGCKTKNFYEKACKIDVYYTNAYYKEAVYSNYIPSNIKEITYEQFKKHVLKEKDTDKSTSIQLTSLPDKYFVQPENHEQDAVLIEFRGNGHSDPYKDNILVVDTNHKMFYLNYKKQEFIDKGYIELSFEEWYRLKFSTHIINKYNSILDNVISKTSPKLSFDNDIINYSTGVITNGFREPLMKENIRPYKHYLDVSEDLIIEKQELLDTKVNKIKPVKIDLVDSKPSNVF